MKKTHIKLLVQVYTAPSWTLHFVGFALSKLKPPTHQMSEYKGILLSISDPYVLPS